jgi:acetyl-CoA C-acetyltransferase
MVALDAKERAMTDAGTTTTDPGRTVLLGYARTPFVRFAGSFSGLPAVRLGALAATAAMERAGIAPEDVDQVVVGQVLQAGAGQNPARQTAVAAGVPMTRPAITLNAVCLSGLEAVTEAHRRIALGEADVVLVVGQESMTEAPRVLAGSRAGARFGSIAMQDVTEHDGLTDAFEHRSMGASTEDFGAERGITREEQDAWALRSHRLASAARAAFQHEITPVEVPQRRGTVVVAEDDGIRDDATAESLAALRPSFSPTGTITAGNASPITDGAAAIVVARAGWAADRGLRPLAAVRSTAMVAGPDVSLLSRPAEAIALAAERAGIAPFDVAVIEINEAFASVAVHSVRELGVDPDRVNRDGGAIALGHPIGASGARIVGHLAMVLGGSPTGTLAAAGICGGGGQGAAMVLEAL